MAIPALITDGTPRGVYPSLDQINPWSWHISQNPIVNHRMGKEQAVNTIPAGQFVYSRVDRDRSPNRRDGFQTIFYTRDRLTKKEIEEIEPRVLYYAGDGQPLKRVFFLTSTGKAVIAQMVPLAETDSAGRGGLYLAHGLVFEGNDFESIGAHPFGVFKRFPFISSLNDAFAQGDLKTGNIPDANYSACPEEDREHELNLAVKWPAKELKKLAMAALAAEYLAEKRSAVYFVGPVSKIEEGLAAALFAVPTRQRFRCSFAAHFYKCNLNSTFFWGVGQDKPPANPHYLVVDVVKKILDGDCPEMDTCYGRWLSRTIESESFVDLVEHKDRAEALGNMLDGKEHNERLAREAPEKIVATMCEANPRPYQQHVFQTLARVLHSRFLAKRLLASVISDEKLRFSTLWGVSFADLVKMLFYSFRKNDYRVPEEEWPEFQAVVDRARDEANNHEVVGLELILACKKKNVADVRSRISRLSKEWYIDFVTRSVASRFIEPAALLLPGRSEMFFAGVEKSEGALQDEDILAVIQTLVANGDTNRLDQVVPYLNGVSKNTLKSIEQYIRAQMQVLSTFCEHLRTQKAIEQFIRMQVEMLATFCQQVREPREAIKRQDAIRNA